MIHKKTFKTAETNDSFSSILTEAHDLLKQNHVSILGQGIEEILGDEVLFEDYTEALLSGCNAEDAKNLSQMFSNTRQHILVESQMEGIKPFSSMSFPMQRKAWPRIGIINAVPTEPTEIPKFSISFLHPYVVDAEGERHYLPEALRDESNTVGDRKRIDVGEITVPSIDSVNLLDIAGADARAGDAIDVDFNVVKVGFTHSSLGEQAIDVRQSIDSSSGITTCVVEFEGEKDTVFVTIDRRTGALQATSVAGKIKTIEVESYLSSEANNAADSVGFDVDYKDLDVGTGRHIAAPLSTEWLQDMKAVYQIDGALKLVDIISDFLAQRFDKEGLEHIENTYREAQSKFGTDTFERTFDVKPSDRYSGSFKEWRDEIRSVIDHLASTIKDKSYHTTGHFNVIGNELDVDLITNVQWMFNSGETERSAVNVNYNVGATTGSNKFNILSTPNNAKGVLRMIYIPATPDYSTVKYYPYAFNIENGNGYRDPNRPNLPAVVVNRRHIFDTIMPLVGKINVINNDGVPY